MHDARTNYGIHNVSLFSIYVQGRSIDVAGNSVLRCEVVSNLFLMGPKSKACDCACDKYERTNEATQLDTKTHCAHIYEVFTIFNVQIEEWLVCQIADNSSSNLAASNKPDIPHVNCTNYFLNLKAGEMVKAIRVRKSAYNQ